MTTPAEQEARDTLFSVQKGKSVVVVKGRKVPHGVRGVVFWEGEGGLHNHGLRIGIKDAADTVHWTAASNVEVVLPGFPDDLCRNPQPPAGQTWSGILALVTPKMPSKGEHVRTLDGSSEGKVFWVKGDRLGFRVGPGKDDVVWANGHEVTVVEEGLVMLQNMTGGVGEPPPLSVVGAEPSPPVENPGTGRESLPYPYCTIRSIVLHEGHYLAYNEEEDFLMELTEAAAKELEAVLRT